jgi:hypothetical protein
MHIAERTSHVGSETKNTRVQCVLGATWRRMIVLSCAKYPFRDYRRRLAEKQMSILWLYNMPLIASTLSQERVPSITKRGGLQKEKKKHGLIEGEVIV